MEYDGEFEVFVPAGCTSGGGAGGSPNILLDNIPFSLPISFERDVIARETYTQTLEPIYVALEAVSGDRVAVFYPEVFWEARPSITNPHGHVQGIVFKGDGRYVGTYSQLFTRDWGNGVVVTFNRDEFIRKHLLQNITFSPPSNAEWVLLVENTERAAKEAERLLRSVHDELGVVLQGFERISGKTGFPDGEGADLDGEGVIVRCINEIHRIVSMCSEAEDDRRIVHTVEKCAVLKHGIDNISFVVDILTAITEKMEGTQ